MHVPLHTPNGEAEHGMVTTGAGGADALQTLFDSYNVTMIFASHIHNYYTGVWGKTPFIISGWAGAPPENNETPNHHYILVNVTNKLVNIHPRTLMISTGLDTMLMALKWIPEMDLPAYHQFQPGKILTSQYLFMILKNL